MSLLTLSPPGFAETPYLIELPEVVEARLEVETNKKVPVNPMLLGLNCSWPERQYGKVGYNHPDAQKLIRSFKPSSLRFPHGVWANFYDWESDGRRMTDSYKTPYDAAVKDHPDLKYGFEGLHQLHGELGFDVLFTWNVNYDSPEKGVRRLLDRREKGFQVKRVELGNEIFWKTQRSGAVSDVGKYISVSKAHAAALKAVDPEIEISVPIHWREVLTNAWNLPFLREDYFDAITIHKYIDKKESAKEMGEALDARSEMWELAENLESIFPGKPLWFSEWAVTGGDEATTVIGTVDAWLGFMNHPERFEVACFFQINASHPLIQYEPKTGTHRRTALGVGYEMVRGVFEGGELLKAKMEATQIGHGFDAVCAEAVLKDGEVTLFAVNKTNREVPLSYVIDGRKSGVSSHRAFLLTALEVGASYAPDDDPLVTIPVGGGIVLPPLSINEIRISK